MRGWRNTVEIVLFDISNSMKPFPPWCSCIYRYMHTYIYLYIYMCFYMIHMCIYNIHVSLSLSIYIYIYIYIYIGKLKPVIYLFEPQAFDEVSNRAPRTSSLFWMGNHGMGHHVLRSDSTSAMVFKIKHVYARLSCSNFDICCVVDSLLSRVWHAYFCYRVGSNYDESERDNSQTRPRCSSLSIGSIN